MVQLFLSPWPQGAELFAPFQPTHKYKDRHKNLFDDECLNQNWNTLISIWINNALIALLCAIYLSLRQFENQSTRRILVEIMSTRQHEVAWRQSPRISQSQFVTPIIAEEHYKNSVARSLLVRPCDANGVVWRGDYVFCKFIHSDCRKSWWRKVRNW